MASGTALLDGGQLLARVGLAAGMRVADLGCGTSGVVIIPAAKIVGDNGRAYAVDIQRAALAATESKAKLSRAGSITYIWSDLERFGMTTIPPASLDVALLVSTLHLVTDLASVFRETVRLLAPGGRVLVVEWRSDGVFALGPSKAQRIAPATVAAAASAAGLTLREAFAAGPQHYGFVFVR